MNHTLKAAVVCCLMMALGQQIHAADAMADVFDAEGQAVGTVSFNTSPYGTLLEVDLHSMTPGVNAFHIHEIGQCDPSFGHAGGHYNPDHVGHGFMDDDGVHAGDMPNLHIPATGELKIEIFNHRLILDERLFDADGASVMIHAGADDYASDPAGDAGKRIACGVIKRNHESSD